MKFLSSKRFLDLWRDADLGTPEVEDAKARLAALREPDYTKKRESRDGVVPIFFPNLGA